MDTSNAVTCKLINSKRGSTDSAKSNGPCKDLKTDCSTPLLKDSNWKTRDEVTYSKLKTLSKLDNNSIHNSLDSPPGAGGSPACLTGCDGVIFQTKEEIELLLDSRNDNDEEELIILHTRSGSKTDAEPKMNNRKNSTHEGLTNETSFTIDPSPLNGCQLSVTLSPSGQPCAIAETDTDRNIRIRSLEDIIITQSDESLEDQASSALLLTEKGSPSVKFALSPSSRTSRSADGVTPVHSSPVTTYRFPIILEGDVRMCLVERSGSFIRRIFSFPCLRRWEKHRVRIEDSQLSSWNRAGVMTNGIKFSNMASIELLSKLDTKKKYHLSIYINENSCVIVQTNTRQLRDQWFHSLNWKRFTQKFDRLTVSSLPPEELVTEIKSLVELVSTTPLNDPAVETFTLNVISALLHEDQQTQNLTMRNEIILSLAPLLEAGRASVNMCDFFSLHGRIALHSQPLLHLFAPIVYGILKHNMDFGKYPVKRLFVQEYIQTLRTHEGCKGVERFMTSIHGPCAVCPHLRILPNLISICVSTVHTHYDEMRRIPNSEEASTKSDVISSPEAQRDLRLITHVDILFYLSQYSDWRLEMSSLLQPVPFPHDSLRDSLFTQSLKRVLWNIADDKRCQVHTTLLSVRDGKDGWFELYCPGGVACDTTGDLYAVMLRRLMECCCRRKKFLQNRLQMINPWQTMSREDNFPAIQALTAVLEFNICDSVELKSQIIESLQSTDRGRHEYSEYCKRKILLNEIQQKGGPRKITLPPRSTDVDLSKLLCSGSFGSLECLSLAFTSVTSASAIDIIKLPALRYLNLWCTQFGDTGLLLLSEHMTRLQVLNLCETPITDKGIKCLTAMKSLRKLNLNSTRLTAATFDLLKENLPVLEEYDIRYTDAW